MGDRPHHGSESRDGPSLTEIIQFSRAAFRPLTFSAYYAACRPGPRRAHGCRGSWILRTSAQSPGHRRLWDAAATAPGTAVCRRCHHRQGPRRDRPVAAAGGRHGCPPGRCCARPPPRALPPPGGGAPPSGPPLLPPRALPRAARWARVATGGHAAAAAPCSAARCRISGRCRCHGCCCGGRGVTVGAATAAASGGRGATVGCASAAAPGRAARCRRPVHCRRRRRCCVVRRPQPVGGGA